MSVRQERVASLIKEEISALLQRKYRNNSPGFMTVTDVVMTRDLKIAKVYVSVFGDASKKKECLDVLEADKPELREELAHAVRLRFAPALQFILDETLDRAMNIEHLLKKIHDEQSSRNS